MGQVLVSEKSPVVWIELIDRATGWLFMTLIVLPALVVPIFWAPKVSEVWDSATGLIPVPLSFAVVGDPKALCVTVRAPETTPREDGEKTTLIEHVPPAAKMLGTVPQVFVWLKFALGVIDLIVRGTFWTFVRMMVFAALLLPKVTLPKARPARGAKVTAWTPVPLSGIPLLKPTEPEEAKIAIELETVPVEVGLNPAVIVQNAPGRR
jgi:hypothetical protein